MNRPLDTQRSSSTEHSPRPSPDSDASLRTVRATSMRNKLWRSTKKGWPAPQLLPPLIALAIYSAAAFALFAYHHFSFRHSVLGDGVDPTLFIWFLRWWPFAITHGLNPFVSHIIWAPSGVNITWTTSVPSLAILAWPITVLSGPVVSYNVLTLAAPACAAFAAFILCYELVGRYFPSIIGGWLFGFSSYEIGQITCHLHLDFIACIPILVWLAVLSYKGKLGRRAFIVITSVVLAFQFGISTEIFATATAFGFIALIIVYSLPVTDRTRLTQVAIRLMYSYVLCLALVSPYLYYMAKGSAGVPSSIQPPDLYVADILSYLVPTPNTALHVPWDVSPWAASIANQFPGGYDENGAYLGLPLLMIIAAFGVSSWRTAWTRALLLMFVVLVLCSFGPHLHVMGRSLWPMPWWVADKLPLIHQALPVRFSLYISLVTGIMVALWLASLGEQALLGYTVAFLALLVLAPNVIRKPTHWRTDLGSNVPAFFEDGGYKEVLKPEDNVVVLPYGHRGYSMAWQAISSMYFHMAGGYVTAYTPQKFAGLPTVHMLYSGKPQPGFQKTLAQFCRDHKVTAVILTKGARERWDAVLHGTGWERFTKGDVVVYRVPATL